MGFPPLSALKRMERLYSLWRDMSYTCKPLPEKRKTKGRKVCLERQVPACTFPRNSRPLSDLTLLTVFR